jgi:hypothetical protein
LIVGRNSASIVDDQEAGRHDRSNHDDSDPQRESAVDMDRNEPTVVLEIDPTLRAPRSLGIPETRASEPGEIVMAQIAAARNTRTAATRNGQRAMP